MAASVGNLLRALKEFPMYKVDPLIAADLYRIREKFSFLLPHLQDAEWIRDLFEQEWRRPDAHFDTTELWNYRDIDYWASRIAALAADAEEIVITYNFHLLNLDTSTLYSKSMYLCSFMLDSDNVEAITAVCIFLYPMNIFSKLFGQLSRVLTKDITAVLRLSRTNMLHNQPQPVGDFLSNHDSRTILVSADVVGREEEVNLLEGWLLAPNEEGAEVISIAGKAGLGKTTVAKKVYEQVQKHFDCHAWVFVSSNDSIRHILQNILKGILKSISVMTQYNIDTTEKETLKRLTNSWLIGKKFLLILDDVSSWDIVKEVKNAITKGSEQTKILVTSRVNFFPTVNKCNLKPIYSSGLLKEHARSSLDSLSEFSPFSQLPVEDIATLCDGVPLAMVTVGGMLSRKYMPKDWIKVHQILKNGASFMSLCYADLSPALKSCFLYAASFPCHFEISCKKLKRLWIAEGFVQQDNTRTLEESAQLQLLELIQRNMIQVVKQSTDGEVKTCRILRRMREFALRRSEGDHFSVILKNLKSTLPKKCCRAFLYGDNIHSSTSKFPRKDFKGLYSFLALEENQHQPLNLNDFKLLCVLELQGFCHDLLPEAVGDLVLLRYLGLRGGKIKKLPTSLKKLARLQTLDIRDTFVRELPVNLQCLRRLRHLLLEGSFTDKVVIVRDGIEAFEDLQTLAGLEMTDDIAEGLIELRGIRKLSIGAVQGSHLVHLFEAVKKMERLRSFTMKGSFENQTIANSLPQLYSLEKLRIGGPTKNFYLDWVAKLHSVKCLYFWDSKLTEDPLRALQYLPNLIVLSLCNSYDGKHIEFGERGFPKLKKLSILHCQNLQYWEEITNGAMKELKTLNLGYCPLLVDLPKGFEELHSRCSIQCSNMPAQFMEHVDKLQ